MPVKQASAVFKQFAQQSFKERKGATLPALGRLIQFRYQSRYESQGLEAALQEIFSQRLLSGGKRELQSASKCKVAITTTDTNTQARLLANYNRPTNIAQTPYHFQRFDKPEQELSVWEVARASSAAPSYFKSFYKVENGHTYQDGALKLNNPIFAAHFEMRNIWDPTLQNCSPDMILSIGTGCFPDDKTVTHEPGPRYGIGIIDAFKNYLHIARDAFREDLDCEKVWNEYVQCVAPDLGDRRQRLHRLNIPFRGPKIALDAVDKMSELETRTKKFYEDAGVFAQINEIAAQLIASLFYFERTTKVQLTIKGVIRCRLPQDVSKNGSIQRLARELRLHGHHTKGFRVFPDANRPDRWQDFVVQNEMLDRVDRYDDIFEIPIQFDVPEPSVTTAIRFYLNTPGFGPQMISGFPRALFPQPLTPTVSNFQLDPMSRLNSMRNAENREELSASPTTPKPDLPQLATQEPPNLPERYKLGEWS